jgi:hypothetical protein
MAFKLTESALVALIESVAAQSRRVSLADTAGLIQMSVVDEPTSLARELVSAHYQARTLPAESETPQRSSRSWSARGHVRSWTCCIHVRNAGAVALSGSDEARRSWARVACARGCRKPGRRRASDHAGAAPLAHSHQRIVGWILYAPSGSDDHGLTATTRLLSWIRAQVDPFGPSAPATSPSCHYPELHRQTPILGCASEPLPRSIGR